MELEEIKVTRRGEQYIISFLIGLLFQLQEIKTCGTEGGEKKRVTQFLMISDNPLSVCGGRIKCQCLFSVFKKIPFNLLFSILLFVHRGFCKAAVLNNVCIVQVLADLVIKPPWWDWKASAGCRQMSFPCAQAVLENGEAVEL